MFSRGGSECCGLLGDCCGRGAELVTGGSTAKASNVPVSTMPSHANEIKKAFITSTYKCTV